MMIIIVMISSNYYIICNSDLNSVKHPVHFVTKDGELSPSAFIPFCEFGGNMSAMGVRNGHFNVTTCNSFQAKIINDQLCYEVDLNRFSNNDNIHNEIKTGFIFFMDYNEDRQTFDSDNRTVEYKSFANRLFKRDNKKHASIVIDTIGNLVQQFIE